jgi:hypothetical protein
MARPSFPRRKRPGNFVRGLRTDPGSIFMAGRSSAVADVSVPVILLGTNDCSLLYLSVRGEA